MAHDWFSMQHGRKSHSLFLVFFMLLAPAGCGSGGMPAGMAGFDPQVKSPESSVTAQELIRRDRTPLSYDQLPQYLSPGDPPFSRDLTPFRQTQDFRRKDGTISHQVSVHYETPDIPVLAITDPITRSNPHASHESALVIVSQSGTVLELDINVTASVGLNAPLKFHRGDSLILKGEYIVTDPSEKSTFDGQHHNVIHWTHHSNKPDHPGGHVIYRGVTYQ